MYECVVPEIDARDYCVHMIRPPQERKPGDWCVTIIYVSISGVL